MQAKEVSTGLKLTYREMRVVDKVMEGQHSSVRHASSSRHTRSLGVGFASIKVYEKSSSTILTATRTGAGVKRRHF